MITKIELKQRIEKIEKEVSHLKAVIQYQKNIK